MRALFEALAERGHVQRADVSAMEREILRRFARDHARFSDVLEHSISADAEGTSLFRFSYGFPSFREGPTSVRQCVLAAAEPFGKGALDASRHVLSAARNPCV